MTLYGCLPQKSEQSNENRTKQNNEGLNNSRKLATIPYPFYDRSTASRASERVSSGIASSNARR